MMMNSSKTNRNKNKWQDEQHHQQPSAAAASNRTRTITTKKRKGEKGIKKQHQQYGIDLPDIAGMPMEFIPIHIHTLQSCTQWIQHDYSTTTCRFSLVEETEEDVRHVLLNEQDTTMISKNNTKKSKTMISTNKNKNTKNSHDANNVMDLILHRIEQQRTSSKNQQQQHDHVNNYDNTTTTTTIVTAFNKSHHGDQRKQKHKDAIRTWMQFMYRLHKEDSSKKHLILNNNSNNSQTALSSSSSVPMVAIRHLWDIVLEPLPSPSSTRSSIVHHNNHDTTLRQFKIPIRRAAWFLIGYIVSCHAECRAWLLQNDNHTNQQPSRMMNFIHQLVQMESIITKMNNNSSSSSSSNNNNIGIQGIVLWQQEIWNLLQQLQYKGYGMYYPTLYTTIQLIELQCPSSVIVNDNHENNNDITYHIATTTDHTTTTTNNNTMMNDFRQLRDEALESYDPMEKRIYHLLNKIQQCFDILFPRFGQQQQHYQHHHPPHPPSSLLSDPSLVVTNTSIGSTIEPNNKSNDADHDELLEDDSENIEWEDGMLSQPDEISNQQQRQQSYKEAVEQTLQVIQSTSVLRHGEYLDIPLLLDSTDAVSFIQEQEDVTTTTAPPVNDTTLITRNKMKKLVQKVTNRYLPLISSWLVALTKADSMKEFYNPKNGIRTLIRIPDHTLKNRSRIVQNLYKMKQDMNQTIVLANRIGFYNHSNKNNSSHNTTIKSPPLTTTTTDDVDPSSSDGNNIIHHNNTSIQQQRHVPASSGSLIRFRGLSHRNGTTTTTTGINRLHHYANNNSNRKRSNSSNITNSGRIQVKYRKV